MLKSIFKKFLKCPGFSLDHDLLVELDCLPYNRVYFFTGIEYFK